MVTYFTIRGVNASRAPWLSAGNLICTSLGQGTMAHVTQDCPRTRVVKGEHLTLDDSA